MAEQRHISEFLEGLKDVTRPNLFEIEIGYSPVTPPDRIFVTKVDIPSVDLSEIMIKRFGRRITIPGAISFPDVTIGFHDDAEGFMRDFAHTWQRGFYGFLDPDIAEDRLFITSPSS